MPQSQDWLPEDTPLCDIRTANAFLQAQTAHQAGIIGQWRQDYEALADDHNNYRRDAAKALAKEREDNERTTRGQRDDAPGAWGDGAVY